MNLMKKMRLVATLFWLMFVITAPALGDAFTVTTDGSVGIGTTTVPEATLDVKGTVVLGEDALTIDGDGHVHLGISPVDMDDPLYNLNIISSSPTVDIDGNLKVNGYITDINGMVSDSPFSDARLKKDIQDIDNALELVAQLRGISFYWIEKSLGKDREIGLIAQEVETIFPEVVSSDNRGFKRLDYEKLVAPLIEAVKELKRENERLAKGNKQLVEENQSLKADIEDILDRLEELERR